LLGGFGRVVFVACGADVAGSASGAWGVRAFKVEHPHPNTVGSQGYLARGNPMARTNEALRIAGVEEISW
jgi:hypothetical protein